MQFENRTIPCRETGPHFRWEWNWRMWHIGLLRMRYDALDYWLVGFGPLQIHNDFEVEDFKVEKEGDSDE